MLPDLDSVERIGEFWGHPETREFGDLLIDLEEDKAAQAAADTSRRRPVVAPTVRLVEIAAILGVTHQQASVIVRQPGFPAPVGREGQSRLWDRREVTAWAKKWRREKRWR